MITSRTGAIAQRQTIVDRIVGTRGTAWDAVLVVLGAVLIGLSAAVSIPLPGTPVPVTGQTFGILLVAAGLGGRRGSLAVLLYIAIGVIGLPAFAEDKGGIAVIASVEGGRIVLGATGGYLLGFVLAAVAIGRLAERGWDRRPLGALAALVIGNVLVYAAGLPWLALAVGFSPAEAVAKGLVPFVVGDVLKLVLAAALLPAAWRLVGRKG